MVLMWQQVPGWTVLVAMAIPEPGKYPGTARAGLAGPGRLRARPGSGPGQAGPGQPSASRNSTALSLGFRGLGSAARSARPAVGRASASSRLRVEESLVEDAAAVT